MMIAPILELTADFTAALDLMEQPNQHLFVTGRAGTGKSTLLRLFCDTTEKKVVVLAPTGVAALNARGQTIHSFFSFPPKPLSRKDIKVRANRKLYQKIDTIVIDEISMVRADMLDNIDHFLRLNARDATLPFGGIQMIFFGDLFQLPPVVQHEESMFFQVQYASPYFFSADVIPKIQLVHLELTKVYRQDNHHFIKLLDSIRTNRADDDVLQHLNERFEPDFAKHELYITLSARNDTANRINYDQLMQLKEREYLYEGSLTGEFNPNFAPTEVSLRLRKGAQVMFVKNDPKRRFVNGSIGKIIALSDDVIQVQITDNQGINEEVMVEKLTWESHKYRINSAGELETEVIGAFEQYPLRLAWAITIHKAQGKTFDRVMIDLGSGAFEHGQTYVALSRCRTLEGVVLRQKIRPKDILTDERVVNYYEQHFR